MVVGQLQRPRLHEQRGIERGGQLPGYLRAAVAPQVRQCREVALDVGAAQLGRVLLPEASRDGGELPVGQLCRPVLDQRLPRARLRRRLGNGGAAVQRPLASGGGRVGGQLGFDVVRVGGAEGREPPEDPPPQVDVDGEPGGAGRAQQQVPQGHRFGRGVDVRPGVRQLVVAAGDGAAHRLPAPLRDLAGQRSPGGRIGVEVQRCAQVRQHLLGQPDVGLHRRGTQDHAHVLAGRQDAVPGEVPHRCPADRAGQRAGQPFQPVQRHAKRGVIQPHLGEREVVVVDQQQVRGRLAVERRHRRGRPVEIDIDEAAPVQPALHRVVQAEPEPVRPQRRVRLGRQLAQDDLAVAAVLGAHLGDHGVDPGRTQPRLAPPAEVPAACALQRQQQIGELGVPEPVGGEVVADAGPEGVLTHPRHQLPQDRGTLAVGDAVEVQDRRRGVGHVGGDGVRRRQLVGPVAGSFHAGAEGRPGLRMLGSGRQHRGAAVGGEALVEPQVVPPAHADQVAEPHVGELVGDHVRAVPAGLFGDPSAEQVLVPQRHRPGVLHRARVELRDEQLLVAPERVRLTEDVQVVVEAGPGRPEQLLGLQVLGQGAPAPHAQADAPVLGRLPDVPPGVHRGQVGRQRGSRRENPGTGSFLLPGRVRDAQPVRRRGDAEGERCLQIRLVEAGEHPGGVVEEGLAVEVDLVVRGIDEAVQSLAGPRVSAVSRDGQDVVFGQLRKHQPVAYQHHRRVEAPSVEDDVAYGRGDDFGKCGGAGRPAGELDLTDRAERPRARRQVEADGVAGDGEQRGPLPCLVAGEDAHASILHARAAGRPSPLPDLLTWLTRRDQ